MLMYRVFACNDTNADMQILWKYGIGPPSPKIGGMCQLRIERARKDRNTFGNMIIEAFGHEPYSKDKTQATDAACDGIQKRRPDLVWINPGKVAVVVEIDEDSHSDRDSSCELR